MATLNTSSNGPNITRSYQNVVNAPPPSGAQASSPTYGQWAVFTVAAPLVSAFQQDGGKESVLKVQSTGEGELVDLIDEFSDGRIQFAFVKVKDPNTSLPKNVLIAWCGEGVPERTKGYFGSHLTVVSKLLHGYHVQVTARSEADLTPEKIVQKVADASGAKYSGGGDIPVSSGPPPVAKKPVFTPKSIGGGGAGFNPLGRSRASAPKADEDADGWGADAPQVSRSQLEKVGTAYTPTKVNMAELTAKKDDSTSGDRPEVVRGAYQPVGKVDIAAIRAQAREAKDDRPTVVKGAYEPVGKVDIAAIRAKAQAAPPSLSPAATGSNGEEEEKPKSLAERSAAFSSQPERLTSMPKPKVANKFAGASTFTGTKAPTPGGFGAKPVVPAPLVGAASKTFADEGGKTPAQIWAEKKAARGQPVRSPTADVGSRPAPLQSQQSGGGGWQSGYSGKSWAPVQTTRTGQSVTSNPNDQPEEPASPAAGGVSSLKDRFTGAAPMGAPTSRPEPEEDDVPATQHQRVPSPPAVPRSPSPEPSGSPVRIAMPVARGRQPEEMAPAEEHAPPMPARSLEQAAKQSRDMSPEPQVEAKDPARGAGAAVAAATFGAAAVGGAAVGAAIAAGHDDDEGAAAGGSGKRAVIQYDYEKAEDNEVELREGEYVTDIDMVDDDWWMGTNSQGERGLFPANYVELVEDEDNGGAAPPPPAHPSAHEQEPAAAPAASSGPTATALYDYEAAEDNELSFPEGATITGLEFPDEDWWLGSFNGQSGLFPANYVELDQ
ncbi:SH3-1 multi-domain protein [Pyrenophora tritici-repentis]|nr:SH3-1 multi-domain protein [Pyrenophora tritici-repentis]KAI0573692.1 SH3-1 multi-domain protein [Pyrenophora tritici-repentis]PZC91624.1 SH3-1 multi-domain protein [Pyrenophora tritici-repentis]PZD26218.1 SH3-1 multi-domain protein [Pyrenophora tritici-repentis]